VRNDRSLCVRRVSSAINAGSLNETPTLLFLAAMQFADLYNPNERSGRRLRFQALKGSASALPSNGSIEVKAVSPLKR
jgi:hypothetical protein